MISSRQHLKVSERRRGPRDAAHADV